MSQPNSRARSRRGSQAGSTTAGWIDPNAIWAQNVGWDAIVHPLDDAAHTELPEAKKLKELVWRSFIVPQWLTHLVILYSLIRGVIDSNHVFVYPQDSALYDPHHRRTQRLNDNFREINKRISNPKYIKDKDDSSLAADVAECLPYLLQTARQVFALQKGPFEPVEADRLGGSDTTIKQSGADPKLPDAGVDMTIEDIKKYNKIVIYSIARYSMMDIGGLLGLYLLMRQTRSLAHQYKQAIMDHGSARIWELSQAAEGFYQWAAPPLPNSDQGSTMTVDQDDFDSNSDSDLEELDSGGECSHNIVDKVAAYVKNLAYVGDTGAYTAVDS